MAAGGPTVSVLMAVYNAEPYLAEAVQSILEQSLRELEFLIIDDGSTDGSTQTLRRYAEQDDRIRLVSQPNQGLIATLNRGLSLARGEFLARMDGDDISLPQRLAKQVEYLQRHPRCVAAGCRVLMVDSENLPIREWSLETSHEQIDAAHLASKGLAITHAATTFRLEALRAIGGYRAAFPTVEDYDLFLRLAEYGELANLPEVLYRYRQHPASVCHAPRPDRGQIARRALEEARLRRGLAPRPSPLPAAAGTEGPAVSLAQCHCKWAWWALAAGHVRTARKHALRAWRLAPFQGESWRAVLCALRGR